jgi:hypothetical protein
VGRQLGAWCALHVVLLLLHSLTCHSTCPVSPLFSTAGSAAAPVLCLPCSRAAPCPSGDWASVPGWLWCVVSCTKQAGGLWGVSWALGMSSHGVAAAAQLDLPQPLPCVAPLYSWQRSRACVVLTSLPCQPQSSRRPGLSAWLALVHGFMHEAGRWTVGRQLGAWCALHVVLLLLHSLTCCSTCPVSPSLQLAAQPRLCGAHLAPLSAPILPATGPQCLVGSGAWLHARSRPVDSGASAGRLVCAAHGVAAAAQLDFAASAHCWQPVSPVGQWVHGVRPLTTEFLCCSCVPLPSRMHVERAANHAGLEHNLLELAVEGSNSQGPVTSVHTGEQVTAVCCTVCMTGQPPAAMSWAELHLTAAGRCNPCYSPHM